MKFLAAMAGIAVVLTACSAKADPSMSANTVLPSAAIGAPATTSAPSSAVTPPSPTATAIPPISTSSAPIFAPTDSPPVTATLPEQPTPAAAAPAPPPAAATLVPAAPTRASALSRIEVEAAAATRFQPCEWRWGSSSFGYIAEYRGSSTWFVESRAESVGLQALFNEATGSWVVIKMRYPCD